MDKPKLYKNNSTIDISKAKKHIDSLDLDNNIDYSELERIKRSIINSETIVDDIIELMPNVGLIIETISSLVTSPNNMIDVVLQYEHNNIDLPPEVMTTINEYTRKYVNAEYGLHDNITNIVKKSLYTRGSYIELNLPPVFINELLKNVTDKITATTASYSRTLDKKLSSSIETHLDDRLYITDSLSSIALNKFTESIEEDSSFYSGFERLNLTSATASTFTITNELLSKNNGKPVVIEVDSRDIIPIASKRNPSKHYGYFYIVSDELEFRSTLNYSDTRLTDMYKDINRVMLNSSENIPTITNIEDIKTYVIKNYLQDYTKNKLKDNNIDIFIDDDLTLTIAENIIKGSGVKFIYLPKELVSYYAINFRENGTGQSLIERVATLASIKNIIMFSNLTALVKSNITTTEIDITLDENDPNYRQTIRKILKHVMENNNFNLPIRMLRVDNFIKWSKELGYVVKTNGHPMLPDTEVTITEKANEIKPVDIDSFEKIDNDIIIGLYGIPDMMDNINSPDFATEVRHNYQMLDKRIRNLQTEYNKLITLDINKKLFLNKEYIEVLKSIVRDNLDSIKKYMKYNATIDESIINSKDDEYIVEYITYMLMKNRSIKLQQPLNKNDEVTIEEFNNYVDVIENTIDKLMSSDAMPSEIVGDLSDSLDNVKAALRVMLIRDYMSKNNILPEFNTMFTLNEKGEPNDRLLDNFKEYFSTVSKIALQFIDENNDDKDVVDKKLQDINNDGEAEEDDY